MTVITQETSVRICLNEAAEVVLFEFCRTIAPEIKSSSLDVKSTYEMPMWLVMRIFGPHMSVFDEPALRVEIEAIPDQLGQEAKRLVRGDSPCL